MSAIKESHLATMDNDTPDYINDFYNGYGIVVRWQRYGYENDAMYHVCAMDREGMRLGPWVTTDDFGIARDLYDRLKERATASHNPFVLAG